MIRTEVRQTLRLAIPVVSTQLGGVAMGVTDTIMVGRLGPEPLSAVALGNSNNGVVIMGGQNNIVGGTPAGAGNVISGNDGDGVHIEEWPATGNLVQGNFIGTQSDGTSPLGNASHGFGNLGDTGCLLASTRSNLPSTVGALREHMG